MKHARSKVLTVTSISSNRNFNTAELNGRIFFPERNLSIRLRRNKSLFPSKFWVLSAYLTTRFCIKFIAYEIDFELNTQPIRKSKKRSKV